MCRDLKCNRSNNKVLAWLITGAAADSWRTADIPSPNFVLIPITQCKVVAWPFFTKSGPPLPGPPSASVSPRAKKKAHQWLCRCLYCRVPSFGPVIDCWQRSEIGNALCCDCFVKHLHSIYYKGQTALFPHPRIYMKHFSEFFSTIKLSAAAFSLRNGNASSGAFFFSFLLLFSAYINSDGGDIQVSVSITASMSFHLCNQHTFN